MSERYQFILAEITPSSELNASEIFTNHYSQVTRQIPQIPPDYQTFTDSTINAICIYFNQDTYKCNREPVLLNIRNTRSTIYSEILKCVPIGRENIFFTSVYKILLDKKRVLINKDTFLCEITDSQTLEIRLKFTDALNQYFIDYLGNRTFSTSNDGINYFSDTPIALNNLKRSSSLIRENHKFPCQTLISHQSDYVDKYGVIPIHVQPTLQLKSFTQDLHQLFVKLDTGSTIVIQLPLPCSIIDLLNVLPSNATPYHPKNYKFMTPCKALHEKSIIDFDIKSISISPRTLGGAPAHIPEHDDLSNQALSTDCTILDKLTNYRIISYNCHGNRNVLHSELAKLTLSNPHIIHCTEYRTKPIHLQGFKLIPFNGDEECDRQCVYVKSEL
eukprot:NODE_711_length_4530_cov_1.118935.p2 type:complete len:388 gc:universal NODE_711_length_4530_cov_1.118935:499-1662(+)